MNQDYLIFGAGYHGEVKSFAAGQVEVEVEIKAPEETESSTSPDRDVLQRYVLPVTVIAVDGKRYNVATEENPSEDEVKQAVERWHPQPIQADELL
ncbi:hypothetical protein PANNVG_02062 [Pantoea sp. Nvir]|uniref:hypothetical protein n=1 Tax=Pantoea TaxID=53335 RepID=UPI000CDDD032|nr:MULTISPECIES: hypothetical protein [Pantoea]MCG7364576.1 hypothetical protein [Pantoea sp. ACRSH]MCG7395548.1 hypothetical protein [Pantoea sp. ACRSC]POW57703.1 hypothetical protein C3408_11040 [Pantoea alvi]UBN52987.1 hypothetical protein LB453_13970 [Pantoea agglomerans]